MKKDLTTFYLKRLLKIGAYIVFADMRAAIIQL